VCCVRGVQVVWQRVRFYQRVVFVVACLTGKKTKSLESSIISSQRRSFHSTLCRSELFLTSLRRMSTDLLFILTLYNTRYIRIISTQPGCSHTSSARGKLNILYPYVNRVAKKINAFCQNRQFSHMRGMIRPNEQALQEMLSRLMRVTATLCHDIRDYVGQLPIQFDKACASRIATALPGTLFLSKLGISLGLNFHPFVRVIALSGPPHLFVWRRECYLDLQNGL